ncbi:MAG: response regulator [Bacteroidota bacterium]
MYSKDLPDIKANILLVEDDEADSFAVCSILEHKYTVHRAVDSAEALRLLYLHAIDVIMLDINLGDKSLSGFQLIDYIRMLGKFDKVKIIAMTGKSIENMEANASFIKFDSYLYKPITKAGIIKSIEEALLLRTGEPDENHEDIDRNP